MSAVYEIWNVKNIIYVMKDINPLLLKIIIILFE